MDVSRIRALRGPNLWSRHTAIQAIVSCEGARSPSSAQFRSPPARTLPELGDLIPTDHLDTVSMAHALEFAALGLQAQAGCPVTFSRTRTPWIKASIRSSSNTRRRCRPPRLRRAEELCLAALTTRRSIWMPR
jgi:cyanophycin synthetase